LLFCLSCDETGWTEIVCLGRLQNKALVAANEIMNVFDKGDVAGVRAARKLAEGVFGEGWEAKGAGVYQEGVEGGKEQIWGIGQ